MQRAAIWSCWLNWKEKKVKNSKIFMSYVKGKKTPKLKYSYISGSKNLIKVITSHDLCPTKLTETLKWAHSYMMGDMKLTLADSTWASRSSSWPQLKCLISRDYRHTWCLITQWDCTQIPEHAFISILRIHFFIYSSQISAAYLVKDL